MESFQYQYALPVISLAAFALLVLVSVPFVRAKASFYGGLALLGTAVSAWSTLQLYLLWRSYGGASERLVTAYGMIRLDGIGLSFSFVILAVTALSILASLRILDRERAAHGEFHALMLFCAAGMLVMVNTTHLMMVLIGLEVFSVALYVLTGLTRGRVRSIESALKYFLLGAFSSGFMVYGMALLYGTAGSLNLDRIAEVAAGDTGKVFWLGCGLFLIGLLFKIAVVPFHQWVPDVYEGAPTNVTGFMAAATKTAAFAVLLRFLLGALGSQSEVWIPLITWLAILTMTVANLVALAQNNIKRLLAFSSIAHAGYLLIAVVSTPSLGVGAVVFYLATYGLMTVGVFAVAAAVGRGDESSERGYDLRAWAGLGWSRPLLGVVMGVFLMSLAGIPPTGGFLGKYVVFQAAIRSEHYLLAVLGMLNAVIAAYYYLRILVVMFFDEAEEGAEAPLPLAPSLVAVMAIAGIGVLLLGILPGGVLDLLQDLHYALTA